VEAFMPRDRFVRHLQGMDVMVIPHFEGAANWRLFEAMAGVQAWIRSTSFRPSNP
jgi:hypothetical protein